MKRVHVPRTLVVVQLLAVVGLLVILLAGARWQRNVTFPIRELVGTFDLPTTWLQRVDNPLGSIEAFKLANLVGGHQLPIFHPYHSKADGLILSCSETPFLQAITGQCLGVTDLFPSRSYLELTKSDGEAFKPTGFGWTVYENQCSSFAIRSSLGHDLDGTDVNGKTWGRTFEYYSPWVSPCYPGRKPVNNFIIKSWALLVLFISWALHALVSPHPAFLVHIPRLFLFCVMDICRRLFLYMGLKWIQSILANSYPQLEWLQLDVSDHFVFYVYLLFVVSIEFASVECSRWSQERRPSTPDAEQDEEGNARNGHKRKSKSSNNLSSMDGPRPTSSSGGESNSWVRVTRRTSGTYQRRKPGGPIILIIVQVLLFLVVCITGYAAYYTAMLFHSTIECLSGLLVGCICFFGSFWLLVVFGLLSPGRIGVFDYKNKK